MGESVGDWLVNTPRINLLRCSETVVMGDCLDAQVAERKASTRKPASDGRDASGSDFSQHFEMCEIAGPKSREAPEPALRVPESSNRSLSCR